MQGTFEATQAPKKCKQSQHETMQAPNKRKQCNNARAHKQIQTMQRTQAMQAVHSTQAMK
jgi:hypothetical protein